MSRTLWIDVRQGLLMIVAAIERELKMEPKTADLRRELKEARVKKEARSLENDTRP